MSLGGASVVEPAFTSSVADVDGRKSGLAAVGFVKNGVAPLLLTQTLFSTITAPLALVPSIPEMPAAKLFRRTAPFRELASEKRSRPAKTRNRCLERRGSRCC